MDPLQRIFQRDGKITSSTVAAELGVSRQAAAKRLAAAVRRGELEPVGEGRARHYLPTSPSLRFELAGADEDRILREVESRLAKDVGLLGQNTREILAYVFTEMVNNAIDHSHGRYVDVCLEARDDSFRLHVEDDGIGAFESVRRATGLPAALESAAELTKGKVTSMPDGHTGEGIFFSSRVADRFSLSSNGLELIRDNDIDDIAVRDSTQETGTRVEVSVSNPPRRALYDVFQAHQQDFAFAKTRTVVKLFGLGRDFVSRSEARRLLHGLEAFREVVVDFRDISGIGQGFADEVFRVWAGRHPEVRLIPVNMAEPVRFFVERAEVARRG